VSAHRALVRGSIFLGFAALLLAACATPREQRTGAVAESARLELRYLGQQVLPHRYSCAGSIVGGLSGIDYDPATGRYWLISDDRSEIEPSRFYEMTLDLAAFDPGAEPGHAGIACRGVATLKRMNQQAFVDVRVDPAHAADPESIRLHVPSGRLVWSSEGDRILGPGKPPVLVDPHVWEMERDGRFVRAFRIPDNFRPSADNRGVRRNLAFEGLAFSADFATLYVATENALLQDGPVASLTQASPSRILEYDYSSGAPRAEYVVDVSPIPIAPATPGAFADNGISEILWLGPGRLLVMERSFAAGMGNTIRLFDVDLSQATNVAGLDALPGHAYTPAPKRLVADLASFGVRPDNMEGMTWGPRRADGTRTLILVADDNFNPSQRNLFLAFEVRER
jgi:hypothetical protein